MKVSVVIPNYNGKHFLNKCLSSLFVQKEHIHEIIIVDNGSTDDSVDFIKNFRENSFLIKLIENTENLGFSKAVNQGIKASSEELVFLLNNDVEIHPKCIINLVKCMNYEDNIFSIASKMVQYNNRELIDDAGDEYTILGWTKKIGFNKSVNSFTKHREIFSSCAGAALYKKDIFDKIGYFDENFFAYVEDVDIGYRAKIEGYKNIYCPDAVVFHVGSGTSGSQYNEFKIKISARNNVFLVFKNMPYLQLIINFLFLFLGVVIKFIFFSLKGHGRIYLSGIGKGLKNLNKIEKVKYKNKNCKNYFKIEFQLIKNLFKF